MPKLNPATQQLTGKRIGGGRYELVSILGSGAYGVVYLALDKTSPVTQPAWYAIKCLAKAGLDTRQRKFQRREIALHQLASTHSGVVTLHSVIEESDFIFVVLDFCPDGDLFAMITEQQIFLGNDALIKNVFLQIVSAVEHCHDMGIYHRDLKPENILCRNGGTKLLLADFGLATSEKTSEAFGCGSSFYMSPECQGGVFMRGVPYSTKANDIWALGVILVNLTCGRNPWKQANMDDDTFRAYVAEPNFLRKILPVSVPTNELLKRIFSINPQQRISISELREAIVDIKSFTMTEEELRSAHSAVKKVAVHQQQQHHHRVPAPPSPKVVWDQKAAAKVLQQAHAAAAAGAVKVVRHVSIIEETPSYGGGDKSTRAMCDVVVSPPTPIIPGDVHVHVHRRPATPYTPSAVPPLSPSAAHVHVHDFRHARAGGSSSRDPNGLSDTSSSSASDGSLILTPEVNPVMQDAPLSVIPGGDLDGGDWNMEQEVVVSVVAAAKGCARDAEGRPMKTPMSPGLGSPRGFLRDVVRKIRAL